MIAAPSGYEVAREYKDRYGWAAFARPVGATWWTDCGFVGHAHLDAETLDKDAAELAARWIGHGMVK